MSASTFGARELRTGACMGFRLYCSVLPPDALDTELVRRPNDNVATRPLGCRNDGPVLGICSTPVIHLDPTDLTSGGTMHVISYAARPCGHAKA